MDFRFGSSTPFAGFGDQVGQAQTQGVGGENMMIVQRAGAVPPAKRRIVPISYEFRGLTAALYPNPSSDECHLTEFKLNHFADQPHMRNFIISSAETFSKTRVEYHTSLPSPISSDKLSQISRSYRAILLDLVQSLQSFSVTDSAMLYAHMDFVWHFCEIMFISSHPELPILPYLMSWVQQNFDNTSEVLAELQPQLPNLMNGENANSAIALHQDIMNESLQKVWNMIFLHTIHGRTLEAMKLLPYTNLTKSRTYEEQVGLMQELMRKKPVFTPLSNSISEFESEWYVWHEECESRLNQKAFHGSEQLMLLAKILSGDPAGFRQARDHIHTWYEYLIMMLNYQHPTVRPTLLKGFARKAIEDYGDFEIQLQPIEEIVLSAMDYDIVAVLKDMLLHFQHPWFALHFADLMYCGGVLPPANEISVDYNSIIPIRDDMLLEYGKSLMEHASLWEVGIKYLAGISNRQGWPAIAQLLRKRKSASQAEAEKMIQIAEQFGFAEEAQGICKEQALHALRQDRIQQALLWSIRSTDVPLTSCIVDRILTNDDEVLNIAPILLTYLPKLYNCGERILFLKGFSEFRHFMNKSKYEHAIVVLCQMIHDQLIPKRMGPKILQNLHKFADIGFKFRSEEVSTITQYIHTKLGRDLFDPDEFRRLNQILLMNRAHCLLTAFRATRDGKETNIASHSPTPGAGNREMIEN